MSASAAGAHLLAADVRATKTAMALAVAGSPPRILDQGLFASQRYRRLEDIIAEFLGTASSVVPGLSLGAACFAVAGPVAGNAGMLTNLGWKVEGEAVAREFGVPAVKLVNDFAAAGRGIEILEPRDCDVLQMGTPVEQGLRLIIGAGTGLGMGLITCHGSQYVVHPSEAGHADFAPVDETQSALLAYLRREFGRVSCERVVSGPGLVRIFDFLRESGAAKPSSALLDAIGQGGDAAEAIAEFAAAGRDPAAARALEIFLTAYGAFAGNMALATLARGGVFLAGGIAPKILAPLKQGGFMKAFLEKGRFSGLLATVPVSVVLNPQVGLYGALLEANRLRG